MPKQKQAPLPSKTRPTNPKANKLPIFILLLAILAAVWLFSFHVLKQQPSDWLVQRGLFGRNTPSAHKFHHSGAAEIKAGHDGAVKAAHEALKTYGIDFSDNVTKSQLDVCYRSSKDAGFNTIGHEKTCYYRRTTIMPLKDPFEVKVQRFAEAYRPDDRNSEVSSSTSYAGCKTFYAGYNTKTPVDLMYCPPGTTFDQLVKAGAYYAFRTSRSKGLTEQQVQQLRGPYDDTEATVTAYYEFVPDTTIELYEAGAFITDINERYKNGYVIVGVSSYYYQRDI